MKRSLVTAILGLAVVGTTAAVYGQGTIVFGNYLGAYNQITWGNGPNTGNAVLSSDSVSLALWYGEGTSAGQLTSSIAVSWNTVAEGNGYYGYFNNTQLTWPQWANQGDWIFQIVATGAGTGASALITDANAYIVTTTGTPPPLPQFYPTSIGFQVFVPEPTTLALAGLGAAGLLFLRRR